MSATFSTKVILLSGKVVYINELKVKHYKTILKSILGNELDYDATFINISNVVAEITNLSLEEIDELSFLDYFLLLFEIRSNSIGSLIVAETTDHDNTKIDINIHKLIDHLRSVKPPLHVDTINNITITYKLPTIKELIQVDLNDVDSIYSTCLKSVTINNATIHLQNYNKTALKEILNKLPATYTTRIIKRTYDIIDTFNNVNLISHLKGLEEKQLIFNFNIKNLEIILKLLFGENLFSLYENIFTLAKNANLPPQYIENCTPGEYYLYVKRLESENKTTSSIPSDSNIPEEDGSDHVDLFDIPEMPPVTSVAEF